ncbi:VOC family protein [Mycolicibacterium thermoresistibile]
MTVTLVELRVADPADAWRRAGFSVDDAGMCRVGAVRIRLLGSGGGHIGGRGIVGWSLNGLPADAPPDLDGVPTTECAENPADPPAHANGVTSIDHVVLMSPNLERTVSALGAVGVHPRRTRDAQLGGAPIRQVFYRLGEVILEVVGAPEATGDGPATLWGLTYTVADIDATAAFFGAATAPVKDAVQPGRRITTVRNLELGMSVRTAMISAPYPQGS